MTKCYSLLLILCLCFTLVFIVSCKRDTSSLSSKNSEGSSCAIVKNQLGKWNQICLREIGINIELPVGVERMMTSNAAVIFMHPVTLGGIPADRQFLIEIKINKEIAEQFMDDFETLHELGVYKSGDYDLRQFMRWKFQKHLTTDKYMLRNLVYFRRDVDAPNGCIIKLQAEYNPIVENDVPSDSLAIERILNSVNVISR